MTPDRLLRWLLSSPYPGAVVAAQGAELTITLEGEVLRFDGAWRAPDGQRIPCTLSDAPSADDLYAEIRRGLAVARGITGASWHEVEADCVGSELPADDPLYDRATAEQALDKVTAERDQARQAYLDLSTNNPLRPTVNAIAERLGVCPAEPGPMLAEIDRLKGLADAHAVVSQRLVGSQKEVTEVTERATKAEAHVKRLLRQRAAAHAVLDEAGFAMPQEGKRRRPLAVRVSLAYAQVWDSYDCINAIDEIPKAVGLISPCRSDGATDGEVVARVKVLLQEDADLLRLVGYHQAPIAFNARPLTLAERASFVIRRLWQGRTNAANEAAALRRELSDISDALGGLPDTAEREPIGDREDVLGLSTAERIRLSR